MKENSRNKTGIAKQKFSAIKSLIGHKEFKQALAELREIENQRGLKKLANESEEFYYLFALALQGLGNYKEACLKAKKTLELLKNTSQIDKFAQAQYVLGTIYFDMGELKKAEQELRDAIACFRRVNDKKGIIQIFSELAHLHFVKSDYSKATEYLNECITYCDDIEDQETKAKLAANLGRIYIRIGEWQPAQESLLSAVKIFEEKTDKLYLCQALLSLGYVSYLQRDFKKANKYYEQAIKIIFENGYNREFAIYSEYSGELEFAQGDYEKAKSHYWNCISRMEEIAPESDMISQTYRLLAELQIAEKQSFDKLRTVSKVEPYDEALSSCEKALRVATSLDEKIEIGAIHRALGQIYTAEKELAKAKENFEKSISILEQIGAKFELGKAYLEAGKSDCFDFFERVQYLGRAKDVFKELDSEYHEGLVQLAISKLFYENEEYEKAFLFLKDAEKIFKVRASGEAPDATGKELSAVLSFRKILEKASGKFESAIDAKSRYTFSNIITRNQKMLELLERMRMVKDSELTILLEGETGTGKDLLAKTIHYESRRKNKKFVVAQCSAIPETLLENALFGHVKGAYTGATESNVGLFQEAAGGTLYLDEIAEIPLSTQVKLLRAIEEKEITRIGETKPKKIDVRIIASTSRNLTERVSTGLFRQDLYFRLNALSFKLPPLRERKEDIRLLIKYFLKENGLSEDDRFDKLTTSLKILEDAELMERVLGYDWPGNVRELKHEIEKLAISVANDETFTPQLLSERIVKLKNGECAKSTSSLYDEIAEFEKKRIIEALEQSGGIKSRAAKILGVPEATLWNKLKKYKIE